MNAPPSSPACRPGAGLRQRRRGEVASAAAGDRVAPPARPAMAAAVRGSRVTSAPRLTVQVVHRRQRGLPPAGRHPRRRQRAGRQLHQPQPRRPVTAIGVPESRIAHRQRQPPGPRHLADARGRKQHPGHARPFRNRPARNAHRHARRHRRRCGSRRTAGRRPGGGPDRPHPHRQRPGPHRGSSRARGTPGGRDADHSAPGRPVRRRDPPAPLRHRPLIMRDHREHRHRLVVRHHGRRPAGGGGHGHRRGGGHQPGRGDRRYGY